MKVRFPRGWRSNGAFRGRLAEARRTHEPMRAVHKD